MLSGEFGLGYDQTLAIFHNVVACVLAGSVLGDHCSPISDTTILSSLSSSCNHIEHVRTQLPYALVVGFVATLFGTIPSAYGVPFWVLFPFCLAILVLIVRVFGKK
jgi:Na+/H+ antiporter NhaC